MRMQYSGQVNGAADVSQASDGGKRQLSRRSLTAAAWLVASLSCIALAVVEHERAKGTGKSSILCGRLMSCSDGSDVSALGVTCLAEGESGQLPPCTSKAQPVHDDSNDIFSFGGEARDSVVATSRFGRFAQPGDVKNDEPASHDDDSEFNLFGLISPDRNKPFFEHSRFLKPGDVAEDQPPLHHRFGMYTLGGLLRDNVLDVASGEVERAACCKCIPGAPGYDPSEELHNPFEWWSRPAPAGTKNADNSAKSAETQTPQPEAVQQPAEQQAPTGTEAASAEGSGASVPQNLPSDGIPVVSAVPIEVAQPVSGVQGTPSARRLLSVHGIQRAKYTSMAAIQRLVEAGAASTFIMVSIPMDAKPGDLLKAHGPDGSAVAFSVPAAIPADRIIKVELPQAPPPAPVAPPAPQTAEAAANATQGDAVDSTSNATAGGNTTSVEQGSNSSGEEGVTSEAGPMSASEVTPEGLHVGYGAGLSPPRASVWEACCMCPLYDSSTGAILGWTHSPSAHPSMDALRFSEFKEKVLARHRKIEEALGMHIYPATLVIFGEGQHGSSSGSEGNVTDGGGAHEGSNETALPPAVDVAVPVENATAVFARAVPNLVQKSSIAAKIKVLKTEEARRAPASSVVKTAVATSASEPVQAVATPTTQTVQAVATPATQPVQAVATPATQTVQAVATPATQTVEAVATPTTQPVQAVAIPATQTVEAVASPATQPVQAVATPATQPVQAYVQAVAPTQQPIAEAIAKPIGSLPQAFAQAVADKSSAIKDAVVVKPSDIKQVVAQAVAVPQSSVLEGGHVTAEVHVPPAAPVQASSSSAATAALPEQQAPRKS